MIITIEINNNNNIINCKKRQKITLPLVPINESINNNKNNKNIIMNKTSTKKTRKRILNIIYS